MLETRELCKTYKPKKGQPVLAVDHVSLQFPETGMVFLLGKSGSGKSTMLNLLGGLDQYDGGEIIIKGISSKDFTQQRFDSYRNTYVGFIFQEYNVLEEFTVGANIALALELQGKKATDEEIAAILHDVDLDGYGNRKPNELSGGQKQRVAIARALVKNPEIIMADEPTGALDSNTGRQVLDTLKRLSAKKLVIVVSHDREYAEQYGDRIIELADGKVIRDVEASDEQKEVAAQQLVFRSNTVEIPAGYHLTEEDRIQINEYIDQLHSGVTMTFVDSSRKFQDTDTSKIPKQDGSNFKLIQSKLPMKSAFKIGCSSLKHKRFRLVMTILLSVAAFSMFALVDTFSSYDHIRACTDSLMDSNVDYISVCKSYKRGEGVYEYWSSWGHLLSEEDLENITKDTGIDVMGIFTPVGRSNPNFNQHYDNSVEMTEGEYRIHPSRFTGYVEIDADTITGMGYELIAGTYPDGSKNELAVSHLVYETFVKGGYTDKVSAYSDVDDDKPEGEQPEEDTPSEKIEYEKIEKPEDLVGKTLVLNDVTYTITGVIDTKLDISRYEKLTMDIETMSTADLVLNYMLMSELDCATSYSLTGAAMVGKGKVSELLKHSPHMYEATDGNYWAGGENGGQGADIWSNYLTTLENVNPDEIVWLDGKKDSLAENEIIVDLHCVDVYDTNNYNYSSLIDDGEDFPSEDEIKKLLQPLQGAIDAHVYLYDDSIDKQITGVRIVGYFKQGSPYSRCTILQDELAHMLAGDTDGIYQSAVGCMPTERNEIEKFVRYCYREDSNVRYELQNAVTYELDTVNEVLNVLAKVFLYIGIGFAIFAALLMANFITTSISYKKQEIGILRAIGSRSNDVFRIFFSESFVIAMINFVISAVLCGIGVAVINWVMRTYAGILVTILHFGIRQVILLFLISVAIAAIASFVPVMKIASKRPIDAIRNR